MGLNKITFTHVPYFEIKERLGNTCVLRHGVPVCILFDQALRAHNHLFHFQRSYTLEVRLQTLHIIMSECESLYSNKIFSEAPVFNNLAFIYRFKLPQMCKFLRVKPCLSPILRHIKQHSCIILLLLLLPFT